MDLDPPTSTESDSSTISNSDSTVDGNQFVDSSPDLDQHLLESENSLDIASSSAIPFLNPHHSSLTSELCTMASDSSTKPGFNLNVYSSVPKLTAGSFNDWKLCLTTILAAQRLDSYILTDVKEPTDPIAIADHMANRMTALTALHITVDSENFQVIRNCTSPRDAFLKLCKQHDDAGGLSTANIFTDLVSLKLPSDGSLSEHLHAFRTLHNELQSNLASTPDIKISEPFIAILLIISLPSQYALLVQSLLINFEFISLSRLYSLLKIDSLRSAATAKSETALLTSKNQLPKKKKKPSDKPSSTTVTCSLGHPGHTDEGCRTQRWDEFMEFEREKKAKALKSKGPESAQHTAASTDDQNGTDLSYYDEAFTTFLTPSCDIFDTGATTHMFSDSSRLSNLTNIPPSRIGVASKGGSIWSTTKGSVLMPGLTLRDVLYSSELTANLISIGRLCDDGYTALFRAQDGYILNSSKKVVLRLIRDPKSDCLWHPAVSQFTHSAFSTRSTKSDLALLWHRSLGHLHPDGVICFLKKWRGMSLSRNDFKKCDACTMGKLKTLPANNSFHRAPHVLDLIHTDLLGPISPCSKSGMKYILTFIDDHTRHCTVYLLKSKDETLSRFLEYKSMMERRMRCKIGTLKSDRGGEYSSDEFIEFLRKEGISVERGPANRTTANSVAERYNETLLGRLRTQLIECGLPLSLWGELARYSCLQINTSPHRALNMNSPLFVLESLTPSHFHPFDPQRLKPFGSLCFATDKNRNSKVGPLAKRYIFVGLEEGAHAVRLWDKQTNRILVTGNVVHREDVFPGLDKTHSPQIDSSTFNLSSGTLDIRVPPPTPSNPLIEDAVTDPASSCPEPAALPTTQVTLDDASLPPVEALPSPAVSLPHDSPDTVIHDHLPELSSPPLRRSSRNVSVPDRYGFSATTGTDSDHPTYAQAMGGPDHLAWRKAMQEEFDSLLQHDVGTLVDPPEGANILGGMWVFNRKRDEFNRITRYKARWVVFGNHQIKGFDYNDTYASVGKVDSLRILLALAVAKKLIIVQFDVVTAFLNGDMKDVVHCRQVQGFINPTLKHRVWLLNKSLYGTRQAARRWQQHFGNTTLKFELKACDSDSAVYVLLDSRGLLLIHLHVDDALVFCDSQKLLTEFEHFINNAYDLKWTRKPTLYLGLKLDIAEDKSSIKVSQPQYVESVLERFCLVNCNPAKSPLPQRLSLVTGTPEEVEVAKDVPYQQLVGCLQWIASSTRPDISYAVSQLSRFNSAWTLQHWTAAKHVLRYLKGSSDVGITYTGTDAHPVTFSDSDFSQCPETRRSVSGQIATLASGAVSWKSQRQKVVALSTTEAEYMAAAECAKLMSWIRSFMFDVMHPITSPSPLFVDNTSAIACASNEGIKAKSKHIDRRYHFIRDQIQEGVLEVRHIPTTEMLADFLTKPLGPQGIVHALQINNLK